MPNRKLVFAALVLGLMLPFATLAAEESSWKKGPVCTFGMPYLGHAVSPHETGLITSILKVIYRPEGIKLIHKELPYKRALKELAAGKIQCSLDIRDNRKGFYQGKATMAFYDLSAAHKNTMQWKGVESLEGKKVAYLHGFDIENHVPVKISTQTVYDLSSAYHMLDLGYVAFILDDNRLLKDAMYDSKVPTHDIVISWIRSFEVRPIFSKTEEGLRFRDIYERRMQKMIKSGELTEILQKNGVSKDGIKKIMNAN